MPPRKPDDAQNRKGRSRSRTADPPSRPGAVSLLLFWPFHLWHYLIRGLPALVRWPLRLAGDLALLAFLAGVIGGAAYYLRALRYDLALVSRMPERSIVLDRRGQELGRLHGEKRNVVPLDHVAPDFRLAIVAREDERFQHHFGVDLQGVARSIVRDVKDRHAAQGASTITMQLARNTFPLGGGSIFRELDRKALEVAIALRIESKFTKDQILEHYVNRIPWGHSIMGIEEASRIYFEKHAADLTLSESALLAGIVRGPNAFSPFNDLTKAIRERDTTLDRMVTAKFITAEQAAAAKQEAVKVRPEWRRVIHDSYAMDVIRRDLEIILERENIELGGLTIRTTIDGLIQQKAEEALDRRLREVERAPSYPHPTRSAWHDLPAEQRLRPPYLQGAAVVIENHSGAVLAVVGGRNADESKFNRALQARRQVGSLFKPFVYATAFDEGLRPDTLISDGPIAPGEIKGAPRTWHPRNSDGTFGGLQPVSYGLIRSRNTMSLRIGNRAGMENVRRTAKLAGFDTNVPPNPASYLGAWEATPWEVASAYTIFANGGNRYRPYLIDEIRDNKNTVLYKTPPLSYPAAKPGSAWSISKILQEVTVRGTAASVKHLGFDKPCAGKTGTTDDFHDAWFAGYTSHLTCAVWVGFDQPQRTIAGGFGATLALPVWVEVMKTADRLGMPAVEFKPTVQMVECTLCRESGKRATAACEAAGTTYHDSVPADIAPASGDFCPIHPARAVPVDPDSLTPAPPANPLRAIPVEAPSNNPTRALPVAPAPAPPRAVPVEPAPPKPPRAIPVQ